MLELMNIEENLSIPIVKGLLDVVAPTKDGNVLAWAMSVTVKVENRQGHYMCYSSTGS